MANSITELWYGNLDPAQNFGRSNRELKALELQILRHQEKLEKELGEKNRELLSRLVESMNEYVCINCQQAFCDGYCIGAKMTADALYGADGIII